MHKPFSLRCSTIGSRVFESVVVPPPPTLSHHHHHHRRASVRPHATAPPSPSSSSATTTTPLKVSMVSLGCPKNTVDGEVLLGDLYRSGFDIIDASEDADAIVINTCGFVEDAKAESLDTIIDAARLKAEGRVKKVIVTGCLAQRYSEELAEQLPEADLVVGFQNYDGLASSLKQVLGVPPEIDEGEYVRRGRVQVGEATVGFRPEWDRFRLTPKHTAYLRVAEGCSHACSFCAIPSFRYVILLHTS